MEQDPVKRLKQTVPDVTAGTPVVPIKEVSAPVQAPPPPNPEVVPIARRRRFSSREKARILDAAAACKEQGQLGALLRKEGIYASHLSKWRKALRQSGRAGLGDKRRGPKPDPALQLQKLQRQNLVLQERLVRAETIIDIQKKVSTLLGLSLPSAGDDRSSS